MVNILGLAPNVCAVSHSAPTEHSARVAQSSGSASLVTSGNFENGFSKITVLLL